MGTGQIAAAGRVHRNVNAVELKLCTDSNLDSHINCLLTCQESSYLGTPTLIPTIHKYNTQIHKYNYSYPAKRTFPTKV